MLPLADTSVLGANPKFAALYRDLSSNKLNTDGTSKLDAKALKEREAFEKVSSKIVRKVSRPRYNSHGLASWTHEVDGRCQTAHRHLRCGKHRANKSLRISKQLNLSLQNGKSYILDLVIWSIEAMSCQKRCVATTPATPSLRPLI